MNRKAAGILKYLLSLALAGALVYFALRGIDWRAFAEGLGETRWGYALLYLLAALLALVFREERWRAMMLPLNPEVRRIDAWDSANVGNVVNVVLPGAGEFVRCGYISSKRFSYDKAFGTIVSERAWDVIAVGLLFVAALALNWDTFGNFFVENIWRPLNSRMSLSLWWIIAALAVLAAACLLLVFRFSLASDAAGRPFHLVRGQHRLGDSGTRRHRRVSLPCRARAAVALRSQLGDRHTRGNAEPRTACDNNFTGRGSVLRLSDRQKKEMICD